MITKEFIRKWLKEHKYCVIATSYKDKPWAATVNYSVDDDLNIYISTNPDSLKFKNLLDNPMVCLVIDGQTKDGTLRLQGIAQSLKPKTSSDPNLKIRPKLLVFKKKGKDGKMKVLELNL